MDDRCAAVHPIAAAYQANWPVGFFVTAFAFAAYVLAHAVRWARETYRKTQAQKPLAAAEAA
ncbi:hypothetical protein NGB36_23540 [Streptomyces sp. RB6PN25]|uniref:Uncharacterized protein n=1 Tax=Streptomyces humicola TaxID=2953240 RepID=A0ABT1Q0M7_9ACTN|nr:hypothetical protein [Streptomyces humicola]MCQ4083486.1 hypothetical protein [Streptomyces humicola]